MELYLAGVLACLIMFKHLNKQDDEYLQTPFLLGLVFSILSWFMVLIYGFTIIVRRGFFTKLYRNIADSKIARWFENKQ